MSRHLPNLCDALRAGVEDLSGPLAIVLDFDGTLTRIRRQASAPRMSKARVELLSRLAKDPGIEVIILSGRPMDFLAERAQIPGVRLIPERGIHLKPKFEKAKDRLITELAAVQVILETQLDPYPGASIEAKPTSLVFHYRNVAPKMRKQAIMDVRMETLDTLKDQGMLTLVPGRMMLEFLPANLPDKGDAIRHLMESSDATFIFIGDDATDEPGFEAAAKRGFGAIVISSEKEPGTSAKYHLSGIREVDASLKLILASRA